MYSRVSPVTVKDSLCWSHSRRDSGSRLYVISPPQCCLKSQKECRLLSYDDFLWLVQGLCGR
jgi:hypothetical protein